MNKRTIMNSENFRAICTSYNLEWTKFEIYDDIILLINQENNTYVGLDANYNTIAIGNSKDKSNLAILQAVKESRRNFKSITLTTPPLEEFTQERICNQAQEKDSPIELQPYIQFLHSQIKDYNQILLKLHALGFNPPTALAYLNAITTKINQCINHHISIGKIPRPQNLLAAIGQNENTHIDGLPEIIEILLKTLHPKISQYTEYVADSSQSSQTLTSSPNPSTSFQDPLHQELSLADALSTGILSQNASKCRLHCLECEEGTFFFDTTIELQEHLTKTRHLSRFIYIIDYIGTFATRQDVIKKIYPLREPTILSAIDLDNYEVYDRKESAIQKQPVWTSTYGSLKDIYEAFQKRGIKFTNNIYPKNENPPSSLQLIPKLPIK